MLKNLFLIIQKKLSSIQELKEVEWYLGQDAMVGDEHQLVPAGAYIEFTSITPEEEMRGAQLCDLSFRVYLIQEAVFDDSQRITDQTIAHSDLVDKINKALNRQEGLLSELPGYGALAGTDNEIVIFNRLSRTSIRSDHKFTSLFTTVQEFGGSAYDYSAIPDVITKLANLVIIRDI